MIWELIKVIKTNPKLILANNIKVDMKIMLESSRNFDTIIIPSNCTNDMVIPLSIHKNEINTFYKISSSHKVHKTILWNGIFIQVKCKVEWVFPMVIWSGRPSERRTPLYDIFKCLPGHFKIIKF